MQYAAKLRKGDKVAIVSLSSGMLGEEYCSHNIEIGIKRLKKHGFERLQGDDFFEGRLLGGCLESLYGMSKTSDSGTEGERRI